MKVKYDETLMIKVPTELKEKLQQKASENNQTMSDYVRVILTKEIK